MSSNHVPDDILSEILMNPKLSTEDIVRCALVCKSWYSLVTSPSFVSIHSTRQRFDSTAKKKKKSLVFVVENENRFSLNFDDDCLSEYKRLDCSLKNPNKFKVVDCLNGVVCLWDVKDNNIVFWNPSIRKLLELPKPFVPSSDHHPYLYRSIGFGFDAATNDFKVVRTLVSWRRNALEDHTEVYEANIGRWRRIKRDSSSWNSYYICSELCKQAFLKGVVHWVGETNKSIISFDFRNEVFGRIKVPADLGTASHYDFNPFSVSVMGGESLSLIHHNSHDPCVVWLMKEYGVTDSWIKLCTVDGTESWLMKEEYGVADSWMKLCTIYGKGSWEIVLTQGNGELLIQNSRCPWLLCSYVPDTKLVKPLKYFPSTKLDVFNFTESLALVGVKGRNQRTETGTGRR